MANEKLNNPDLTQSIDQAGELASLVEKLSSHFSKLESVLDNISDSMSSISSKTNDNIDSMKSFTNTTIRAEKPFSSIYDDAESIEFAINRSTQSIKSFSTYLEKNARVGEKISSQNEESNAILIQAATLTNRWGVAIQDVADSMPTADLAVTADIFDSIVNTQDEMIASQLQSKTIWNDTLKGQVNLREELDKIVENEKELEKIKKIILKEYESDITEEVKEQLKIAEDALSLQKDALSTKKKEYEYYQRTSIQLEKTKTSVSKISESITGGLAKLPGGEWLAKKIKIDGLADTITKKLSSAVSSGGIAQAGLGSFAKLAGGAALFGGILGKGLHMLMEVDAEVSQIGKDFGITRKEAMNLHHETVNIAGEMSLVGIHGEQVLAGVKTISEAMGGIDIAHQLHEGNEAAKQLVKDATVLTEKFGLSGDEIKNVHTLATLTGKSMGQLTMEATTLGKGLMTNKEAMKTLASIPKSVAVAFKGGTQELIKAAQKAKMLGMELSQVQQIGDGMLDIEQSLGKEMEARALTGKNLQLDAARMLALQGDTAGLQDEILKQAGSLEEFQNMNRIQQTAFADAMGMSVDEMTGMLTNAQKLKDIGMSSAHAEELQGKNAEELRKIMANTSDEKQKAYIEEIAKQKESASIQERFQSVLKKVQEKLAALLSPILEIVHGLLDSVSSGDSLANIVDVIRGVFANIVPVIKGIFKVIGAIAGPIFSILGALFKVDDTTKEVHASFGGVAGVLGIVAGFFVGKALLTKGMDMLKEKAVDAGKAIMDKVGGAMGKVADKGKGLTDKIMPSKGKTPDAPKGKGKGGGIGDSIADFVNKIDAKKLMMSAAAILILAAALWVAAKAFQEFGKTNWEGIAKGVVGLLALVGVAFLIDKIKGQIIMGSVALLILSAALLVMAIGFEKFGNMDWSAIGKGVLAIVAVAGVAVLIGMVAPLAMAGAAALLVLGAAVLVFGAGMYVLGAAVEKIAPLIENLFGQFVKLLSLDPTKLPLIAIGITAIAGALGTLAIVAGAGGAAAGIGSAIAGLFGTKGPMEMVMEISQKIQPDRLSATAKSIRELADAFKYFATETAKLADFDVDKIDAIIEKMEDVREAQSGGLGGAITGAAKAITGFIGNIFGSSEEQKTTQVQGGGAGGNDKDKLDTVIQLLSQIAGSANQPTVIKFGDKTVEEIKTQLNFKKAYNVNIDNTYGRTT